VRAARLHGIGDLRIETLPDPEPGAGELLVRVEACGLCPTDLRKFLIGTSDGYPLNPGHEWLGHVEALGDGVEGWSVGDRVYGDTYAGYADLALLATAGNPWSHGPLAVPDDLPADRAVFIEPLADCLHAVIDQGAVTSGARVIVLGAGQMGLQLAAAAAHAGASVRVVEPDERRRGLALAMGAAEALAPDQFLPAGDADCVVLSIGNGGLVPACIDACAPGGRVVLFAGFGDQPMATLDLNAIHYREIAVVGSEWIGTPPNVRRERYAEARDLLAGGLALEQLVERTVDLDGIADAFTAMRERRLMKAVLRP
jgi:2-desacetyl-2-hydroxyethyl bacteriochlorophyllide A dehydrogenase